MHPAEYALQIQLETNTSRNTSWSNEEVSILAKFELDLRAKNQVRNVNQIFHNLLSNRSVNQITCLRKRNKYKEILNMTKEETGQIRGQEDRQVIDDTEVQCTKESSERVIS